MKKKISLYSLTLTAIFMALFSQSCNDKSPDLDFSDITGKAGNAAQCANLSQSERYGTAFYDLLTYDFGYFEPEDHLPADIKDVYMWAYNGLETMMEGWSFTQKVNYLQQNNFITSIVAQNFLDLETTFENGFVSTPDFSAIISNIQGLTSSKLADVSLSCTDKRNIVAINSIAENYIRFLGDRYGSAAGMGSTQISVRGDCGFWKTLGCLGSSMLDGFLIGSGALAFTVPVDGIQLELEDWDVALSTVIAAISTTAPVVIAVGAFFGTAIGLVSGVLNLDDCCPGHLDCRAVIGVAIRFDAGCDPIGNYKTWGFGNDDVSLNWANNGGTPASVSTLTSNPRTAITQTNPNSPVTTIIASVCSDGSTDPSIPFVRNLSNMVGGIVNVNLLGPDEIYPGETYLYNGYGVLWNPNYTTKWFVSYNGTLINQTKNDTYVQWDEEMEEGWVELEVTNTCSGQKVVIHVNVTGDGPIP